MNEYDRNSETRTIKKLLLGTEQNMTEILEQLLGTGHSSCTKENYNFIVVEAIFHAAQWLQIKHFLFSISGL